MSETPINLSDEDTGRFWSKVDVRGPDECWLYRGAINHKTGGHGSFWLGHIKADVKAHRVSWVIKNGEIPVGMRICHSCDVGGCVNPSHLWLGTQADNIADMHAKGRSRNNPDWKGSNVNFAKLTEADVLEIRGRRASGQKLKEISSAFNVSEASVSLIARGKQWKHLPIVRAS